MDASIVRSNPPLPQLRDLIGDGITSFELDHSGFIGLANHLGQPVSARRGGPLVDRLVPRAQATATPRSLSARHGLGRFPFHTDAAHHRLPPRLVMLRQEDGARSKTPTELVDFESLTLRPEVLAALHREPWLIRGGPHRNFYATILTRMSGEAHPMLRFDSGCMEPVSGTEPRGGRMLATAFDIAESIRIDWHPNLVMVWDNWRFVHARPSVPKLDTRRVLERILVAPKRRHG